jgi:hypothetical protein
MEVGIAVNDDESRPRRHVLGWILLVVAVLIIAPILVSTTFHALRPMGRGYFPFMGYYPFFCSVGSSDF